MIWTVLKIAPKSNIGSNENEAVSENFGTTFEFTSAGISLGSASIRERQRRCQVTNSKMSHACLKEVFVQDEEAASNNAFYKPPGKNKVEQIGRDLLLLVTVFAKRGTKNCNWHRQQVSLNVIGTRFLIGLSSSGIASSK